jgi:hypothetical protein
MSKKNTDLEIDWDVEPYSRKWNGGLSYHPYKNYVYGAMYVENTKAEFMKKLEAFQRKMKELKNRK